MQRLLAGWIILIIAAGAKADLPGYVAQPDAAFRFETRARSKAGGTAVVELKMISQRWHDIEWKHLVWIARPEKTVSDSQAILVIAGSSWKEEYDAPVADATKLSKSRADLIAIANQAQLTVALVEHVPFQPILGGKKEDQIIAYTFDQFLKTEDPSWPLLSPMTKAAVRAMDAAQKAAADEWGQKIEHFTVTGGSKRGWTTWLAGAVDPRINSIAPMVIDTLNMGPQMKHQLATWGKYSEQIEDYTTLKIQERMNTPAGQKLTALVDPYTYRAMLSKPKLIINGTNDRYWPLDALNLYWDGLEGEKHVLYVPNNGHGIKDFPRALGGTIALAHQSAGLTTLPKLSWKLTEEDAGLRLDVASAEKPANVVAWTASSPTLDFREAQWTSQPAAASGSNYFYVLPRPQAGYAAVFGEAVYASGDRRFYLSTNVRILPSTQAKPAGGQ